MKWNCEWIDLQNIERNISECWRMNDRQLEEFCEELLRRQDLVLAGAMGLKFLELLRRHVNGTDRLDWSKLQKDVSRMQELIRDGYERDEDYWHMQYAKLSADPSMFYTKLGRAFIGQIAEKLELNLSEDRRQLRHDIEKIEKICSTYNWNNEAEVHKALSFLTKKAQTDFFSSWVGKGFMDILLDRFDKKEEPSLSQEELEALMPALEMEQDPKDRRSRKIKIAVLLVISIGAVLFGVWVYLQIQNPAGGSSGEQRKVTASAGQKDPAAAGIEQELDQNGNQETVQGADHAEQPEDTADTGLKEAAEPEEKTESKERTESEEETNVQLPDVLAQYASFYEKYPDVFGWLKIPGTEIDHPVMQADPEERGEPYYYLHRDYTGRETEKGSLFVENRSSCYPQDDNTVIYGHNMSNNHDFGMLEHYKEKGFYKKHSEILYDTIYETGTYEVAAVLITRVLYQDETGFRYYQFYNYDNESEFQECVDFIERTKLYETGVELEYGDQLLMLSTCEYSRENGRLVVVAKRIA